MHAGALVWLLLATARFVVEHGPALVVLGSAVPGDAPGGCGAGRAAPSVLLGVMMTPIGYVLAYFAYAATSATPVRRARSSCSCSTRSITTSGCTPSCARRRGKRCITLVKVIDRARQQNGRALGTRARLAEAIARALHVPPDMVETITLAALLHDVGKLDERLQTLLKKGPFTPEQRAEMARHPDTGYSIVSGLSLFRDGANIIRHHHELYDGTGYPDTPRRGYPAGLAHPHRGRQLRCADLEA